LLDQSFPVGLATESVGLRLHDARRMALHSDAEGTTEIQDLLVGET
jgi:hypothetical protein